jgi:hypothetical protein
MRNEDIRVRTEFAHKLNLGKSKDSKFVIYLDSVTSIEKSLTSMKIVIEIPDEVRPERSIYFVKDSCDAHLLVGETFDGSCFPEHHPPSVYGFYFKDDVHCDEAYSYLNDMLEFINSGGSMEDASGVIKAPPFGGIYTE